MALIAPTVETIGDEALTNSIIDRSITELQDNIVNRLKTSALYNCSSLTKAAFSSVATVDASAFRGCSSLEVVDFHSKVYFYGEAFHSCAKLTALILRSNSVCTLPYKDTFTGTPIANGTGYIYVPSALVDSYKTAANWSTYANQIRAIEDYPDIAYGKYSWEAVAAHIEKGDYADVYAIGDCVPLDLGSEGAINMQIAAFDVDALADGSGTAAISWVAKELLKTKRRMNKSRSGSTGAYTEGTGSIGGWEKCEMRSYLNDTIKPMISADAASQIVLVRKTHNAYDTTAQKFAQTTQDEVWIPSKEEVYDSGGIYTTLFPDKASRGKFAVGGTSVQGWWLRTPEDTQYWKVISEKGGTSINSAGNQDRVCLGFCTGKSK